VPPFQWTLGDIFYLLLQESLSHTHQKPISCSGNGRKIFWRTLTAAKWRPVKTLWLGRWHPFLKRSPQQEMHELAASWLFWGENDANELWPVHPTTCRGPPRHDKADVGSGATSAMPNEWASALHASWEAGISSCHCVSGTGGAGKAWPRHIFATAVLRFSHNSISSA